MNNPPPIEHLPHMTFEDILDYDEYYHPDKSKYLEDQENKVMMFNLQSYYQIRVAELQSLTPEQKKYFYIGVVKN